MVIVKNKYPKQTQNKIWRGLLAMGSDSLWGSRRLELLTVLFFSSDGLVPFWCGVCAFDWSSTSQRSTTTRSGHNKVCRNHSRCCVRSSLSEIWQGLLRWGHFLRRWLRLVDAGACSRPRLEGADPLGRKMVSGSDLTCSCGSCSSWSYWVC